MRVYKFLNAQFGMKSIKEKRLKISTVDDLNDPFELLPFGMEDKTKRIALNLARSTWAAEHGILCFSADWRDPVIWAHYSDKHRGLCLGFEIPHEVVGSQTQRVEYISDPLPFPADFARLEDTTRQEMVKKMMCTKYRNWEYEHEIRTWTDLEEEFFDFCETLRLAEVIIGAECQIPIGDVMHGL